MLENKMLLKIIKIAILLIVANCVQSFGGVNNTSPIYLNSIEIGKEYSVTDIAFKNRIRQVICMDESDIVFAHNLLR